MAEKSPIDLLTEAQTNFDNFLNEYTTKFGTDPMEDLITLTNSENPSKIYDSNREKYDTIRQFYSKVGMQFAPRLDNILLGQAQ